MKFSSTVVLSAATLACFSLASARPAAAQHVYDASADFSTTANPSPLDGGVFSYGEEPTLGGAFSLYAQTYTQPGNGGGFAQGWSNGSLPILEKNTSGVPFVENTGGTTISLAPDQLLLHPGPNGEYSVLRFTAPATSTFSFAGDFNGADSRPTTTDVHVLLDNVSVADGGINVNGGGNTASLSSSAIALTKGQTLDFVVGYGNGNYYYDSTGLFAKVTDLKANPVPEASSCVSFGLMLLGGAGAFLCARRRKAAQAS